MDSVNLKRFFILYSIIKSDKLLKCFVFRDKEDHPTVSSVLIYNYKYILFLEILEIFMGLNKSMCSNCNGVQVDNISSIT
jgi:hypothetical protein